MFDVICMGFDHFKLMDLKGLAICTCSLVGFNLPIKFYCRGDFEGLIVILAITSSCKIHSIWDLGGDGFGGFTQRLWCRRGFEIVIVLWVFAFSCGIGAICDSGVGNLRGVTFEGWFAQYPQGAPSINTLIDF